MPRDGTSRKTLVQCTKPGCQGTCPLNVVVRSNRWDGTPAKCFQCDRLFKVPAGFKGEDAGRKNTKDSKGTDEASRLQRVIKDNAELRKQCEELKKPTHDGAMDLDSGDGSKEDAVKVARIKEIVKGVRALKAIPPQAGCTD